MSSGRPLLIIAGDVEGDALVEKGRTTLVDGGGGAAIEGRRAAIRTQMEDTTSDHDREKLRERLAKLAGGVAVIRPGGRTEVEVKRREDRVDDALNATRGCPGGGGARRRRRPWRARAASSPCRTPATATRSSGSRSCERRFKRRCGGLPRTPATLRTRHACETFSRIHNGKGAIT